MTNSDIEKLILEASEKFGIRSDTKETQSLSSFIQNLESYAISADEEVFAESMAYELQIVAQSDGFRHLEPGRITLLVSTQRMTLFQYLLLDLKGAIKLRKVIEACRTLGFKIAEILALILRGRIYSNSKEWAQAISNYSEALSLSEKSNLDDAVFACKLYISNDMMQRDSIDEWYNYLRRWEKELESTGKDETRAEVLSIISEGMFKQGKIEESKKCLNDAISLVLGSLRETGFRNALGLKILRAGDTSAAIFQFNLAYELAESLGAFNEIANSQNNMAIAMEASGDFDKAFQLWNEALENFEKTGNQKELGTVNGNIGNLMSKKGEHKLAKPYFERAVKFATLTNDIEGLATSMLSLGGCEILNDDFEVGMKYYSNVEKLGYERGIPEAICGSKNNQGDALSSRGHYKESIEILEESLEDARKFHIVSLEIKALGSLVASHVSMGNYQVAIGLSSQALELARKLKDPEIIASQLNSRGSLLSIMGLKNVSHLFGEAREIAKNHNLLFHLQTSLFNLSVIESDSDTAISLLEECMEINERIGNASRRTAIKIQIANIHLHRREFDKAINIAYDALDLSHKYDFKNLESTCHSILADISMVLGVHDYSLIHSENALRIDREIEDRYGIIVQLTRIGQLYHLNGDFDTAYKILDEAIDFSENLVGDIVPDQFRINMREKTIGCYKIMCRNILEWYLIEQDINKKATLLNDFIKYSDRLKAREMRDKLKVGRSRNDLLKKYPEYEELLIKEQEVTDKEIQLRVASGKDPTLLHELHKSKLELDNLRIELQEKCPEPGLIRTTSAFDPLPLIESTLLSDRNVVIWEFFYFPEMASKRLYVLSISENNLELHLNEDFELGNVTKLLSHLFEFLESGRYDLIESELVDLGTLLGKMLPETLWSTINNKELLIIVPHGILHRVPWNVAINPKASEDSKTEGYLGLELPIQRSYSIGTSIFSVANSDQPSTDALLIANPNFNREESPGNIEGSEDEIREVREALESGNVRIIDQLERSDATVMNYKKAMTKNPGIVHFAGHAQFISSEPWRSHLSFYAKTGYEKYSVTDMYLNKLVNSPLLFLSACNTASAQINQADEPTAMVQGLLLAGAGSVIASNWVILDSQMKVFPPRFYNSYLEGPDTNIATALHKAKLESHIVHSDPIIFWAAFDLYGNPFASVSEVET